MSLKNEFKNELSALSERVRAVRKALKIKQQDMAANYGMSRSYIAEVESGKRVPRPELIMKLYYDYGVNPHYLLFGTGDMFDASNTKKPNADYTYDFTDAMDYTGFLWLLENAPYFRNDLIAYASKKILHEEDTIKLSISKYKKKENKPKE